MVSKYDEDLVLRFLWLQGVEDPNTSSLGNFQEQLEVQALRMARAHSENSEKLSELFNATFDHLAAHGGEQVFRKWNVSKQRFEGGFLNTAYEVIAMGLGYCIANGAPYRQDVEGAAKELWEQPDMTTRFATGKATNQRLAIMLPKGRTLMAAPASQSDQD